MDRLRKPLNSPEFRGAKPRKLSRTIDSGMLIVLDIARLMLTLEAPAPAEAA